MSKGAADEAARARQEQLHGRPPGSGMRAVCAFLPGYAARLNGPPSASVTSGHAGPGRSLPSPYLEGIVQDEARQSISGARISIEPRRLDLVYPATTSNLDGRFRAGPLSPGMNQVTVSAPGHHRYRGCSAGRRCGTG
ncbi:carboxypeptidase-like regulatory domain-containing protein [Myxococcus virescens]|uniref:carboxypeptidase-like regulatory domain-containing protein n=1 Tax=Myxococcus virescens TaxID=83456 RepID=UPI003DA3BC78